MISLYCYRQRTIAVFANRKFVRYRHNKNRNVFYFGSNQGETIKSYICTVHCTMYIALLYMHRKRTLTILHSQNNIDVCKTYLKLAYYQGKK